MSVVRDVVFSRLPGYRPLSLDLHLPPDGAPRAVCLYLHGGGWRLGARGDGPGPPSPTSGARFDRIAAQGLAVASVDYRLSGEARFPAQRDDVLAAWTYLSDHRTELGLDGLPFVAWGVSAGGHLAALLALDPALRPAAGRVVCWYPPTDLLALPDDVDAAGGTADRGPDSREARLLGSPAAEVPTSAVDAGPVSHAHAAPPPFLLVHGSADVDVPPRQSRRLAEALRAAGGQADVELVDGYGHMFLGLAPDALDALIDRSVAFLLDRP